MRPGSVSAKIFAAFLAMLAIFGLVTVYGTLTMRRLGDELRRISSGYLPLRLDVQELQTRQDNLLKFLEDKERTPDERFRGGFAKRAVETARSSRLRTIERVAARASQMRDAEPRAPDRTFLGDVTTRLANVDRVFVDDEPLFEAVYGPVPAGAIRDDGARDRLVRREQKVYFDLGELSRILGARVQNAEHELESDERRGLWATLVLATVAALLALSVMFLAGRALAPLRRLADSAKRLARGDLSLRVPITSSDEIGQLAGEFNAMAAALEEREQRLLRAERLAAVGKIAAQVAHEVRNPLSSIGLNAELILDESESSEARDLAKAIVGEVDRLAVITEQYLRLARMPRPQLTRADANAIVSSLLAFVREELVARRVAVSARLGERLPAVAADEGQLRQALLNLVRNAAEAMPEGGSLTVETAHADDPERPVEIVVADTGPGIAPEVQARLFEPFFSTKTGGTGLGLALTHQIVVEHGGAVEVESAPGRGTRFVVRLPAWSRSDATVETAVTA